MIDPREKVQVSKRDLWEVLGRLWEKEKKDYENVLKHHMFRRILPLAVAGEFSQESVEDELTMIFDAAKRDCTEGDDLLDALND